MDKNNIEVFTLTNGIRVVAEKMDVFPSVCVGMWIGTGSGAESEAENGMSHFIEHMLFKSTENRSTLQIAAEMDRLGGQVNAFTSKECTCYYAKVITEHLPRVLELLSDILLHSRLDPEEMERERGVILEEIAMAEDTPDELVFDLLSEGWFGNHPMGRPILGYADRISRITCEELRAFRKRQYQPENLVVSVVGSFDSAELRSLCEAYLGGMQHTDEPSRIPVFSQKDYRAVIKKKNIEQVHMAMCWNGASHEDDRVYPISVMCNILGGGNASRLFQRIREDMGAAYSVYCYPAAYTAMGTVSVYAGTGPAQAQLVAHTIHEEIEKIKKEGVTPNEFDMAKEQLRVSYILGMENSSSRMSTLGRNMLMKNTVKDPSEVLRKMEAVTIEDVQKATEYVFSSSYAAAAIGMGVEELYL